MSADNTILILQTKDGFRVGEFQAVENLRKENGKINLKKVKEWFFDCPVYNTRDEVMDIVEIFQNLNYVEYGIKIITDLKNEDFPS